MLEGSFGFSIPIRIRSLPGRPPLPLPGYATSGAAGLDLASAETLTLDVLGRAAVGTGLAVAVPDGFEAQIRPRSGLALKHGVTVLNAPGTIDADYRGEVKVLLINLGNAPFTIRLGDRIAQMVVAPVSQAELHLVATLEDTARGGGGFGHTGR